MFSFKKYALFLFLPLLFIQGCGFKLNATHQTLAVCIKGKSSDLLKKTLALRCDKNSYQLIVINTSINQSDIANSMNNSVRQYQLERFILFDINTSTQKNFRTNVRLSVNKPYIVNNNSILSSNAERKLLDDEMEKELISRLKFYLYSQLK